jgi:hypothetical protein
MEGDVEPTTLCAIAALHPLSRGRGHRDMLVMSIHGMRFALASREICAAAVLRFRESGLGPVCCPGMSLYDHAVWTGSTRRGLRKGA